MDVIYVRFTAGPSSLSMTHPIRRDGSPVSTTDSRRSFRESTQNSGSSYCRNALGYCVKGAVSLHRYSPRADADRNPTIEASVRPCSRLPDATVKSLGEVASRSVIVCETSRPYLTRRRNCRSRTRDSASEAATRVEPNAFRARIRIAAEQLAEFSSGSSPFRRSRSDSNHDSQRLFSR